MLQTKQPADHAQHVEWRAEENTWVSTWTRKALARSDARESGQLKTTMRPRKAVEREQKNLKSNANSRDDSWTRVGVFSEDETS